MDRPDNQRGDPETIGASADHLLPSFTVPDYALKRLISRGGQAYVFEAQQQSTGRTVAVKVMREGPFATARDRARFDREVQILATLDHPHIVRVIDRGQTSDNAYFMAMDYVAGEPLHQWLADRHDGRRAENHADDPAELLRLFLKVCDAVNTAHLRGIVHRDLKPSNILVDGDDQPHVVDFGLARTALPAMTDEDNPQPVTITGQFLGSLPWASPEQAEGVGSRIDTRSDVYSLGVILYQILTGRFPYAVVGTMREVLNSILTAEPLPPSAVMAARDGEAARQRGRRGGSPVGPLNEAIDAIVLKALAKRREQRYQTAGELARDIMEYLSGGRPKAVMQRPAPPKKSRWITVGLPVLAPVAIAAIVLAVWGLTLLAQTIVADGSAQTRTNVIGQDPASKAPPAAQLNFAQRQAARASSVRNLRAVVVGCTMYATSWRDRFPSDLDALLATPYVDLKYLVSPLDVPEVPEEYFTWSRPQKVQWAKTNCSYVLIGFGTRLGMGEDRVFGFEKPAPYKGGTAMAFEDGSTRWMSQENASAVLKNQTGKTMDQLVADFVARNQADSASSPSLP